MKAWLRQVQWRHPAEPHSAGRAKSGNAPLFVPSEYNPVWEHVTLGPVWEAISDELVRWRKPVYPPYQKMTQSLQRTKNFWDLVRRSNREIVEGNEQEASIALKRMSATLCGPLPIRSSNSE